MIVEGEKHGIVLDCPNGIKFILVFDEYQLTYIFENLQRNKRFEDVTAKANAVVF